MTRCLITVVGVVMLVAAASAYAAVHVIPPDRYPPGCDTSGVALQGDAADDVIKEGSPRRDLLRGGGGEDLIKGKDGSDCLMGQRGADKIVGGENSDKIKGGRGGDRLRGSGGLDRLAGGQGNDRISDLHARSRILCGGGFDRVTAIPQSRIAHNCEQVHTHLFIHNRYASVVSIKDHPTFHGVVRSFLPACKRHRTVQVRRRSGRSVGHAKSDERGKWELPRPGLHGRFDVRVLRKEVGGKRPQSLCLPDTSDHPVRIR
jgi:hypothetical protein